MRNGERNVFTYRQLLEKKYKDFYDLFFDMLLCIGITI